MQKNDHIFFTFSKTISALRGEKGCPWDQKQTIKSLTKYLRQECDELLEAMASGDNEHICEETGDLLFILFLICQISAEEGHFTMDDALQAINEKMLRRHPHVFGDVRITDENALNRQWERIKSLEKSKKTN